MKRNVIMLLLGSLALITSVSPVTSTQDPVKPLAPGTSWAVKVLDAELTDSLEHIDTPADWRWLIIRVEFALQKGTPAVPVSRITLNDENGEKYGAFAMDCEVPVGMKPDFIEFSNLKGRGPRPRSLRSRGGWGDIRSRDGTPVPALYCGYEGFFKKGILILSRDEKTSEATIAFQEFAIKRKFARTAFAYMVMAEAASFELQVGDGPRIPIPFTGKPPASNSIP